MKKSYRVARITGGKIKREDVIELTGAQVTSITNHCSIKKDGYSLDEEVLTECLDLCSNDMARFTLLALLIDVQKGFQIVVYISDTAKPDFETSVFLP